MCTATWITRPAGFDLLFNRDELRGRAIADPPRVVAAGTSRAIAPRDGEQGGTWIGVNTHGVALALLNRYEEQPADEPDENHRVSRGVIPVRLLDARSAEEALQRLADDDLSRFRPFDLLLFEPGLPPRRASWNGRDVRTVQLGNTDRPVISSSFRSSDVGSARRATYERLVGPHPDVARLAAYHASHEPRRGPRSPCMHRDEAATVSASWISVEAERVVFRYAGGPPCRTPFAEPGLSLPRD